ncbi:hypothetical protein GO013_01985 [Pseudodesulfovibrio sp. JC047]|nr:hypothetical protein [Pseudodesulfovibrio sp. JC047]NDV18187.1 hypothetical protein [Pseudodesulfovibrio sp. JC047]
MSAWIQAQEGVDISIIQAILRQKNLMTTELYLHRLGGIKNVVEDVFG